MTDYSSHPGPAYLWRPSEDGPTHTYFLPVTPMALAAYAASDPLLVVAHLVMLAVGGWFWMQALDTRSPVVDLVGELRDGRTEVAGGE